jgi:hypothetical protein
VDIHFRHILNRLGIGLRACYVDVLREREPVSLRPLIDRLLGRPPTAMFRPGARALKLDSDVVAAASDATIDPAVPLMGEGLEARRSLGDFARP